MPEKAKHAASKINWSLLAVIGTVLTVIAALASLWFAPLSGYTLTVLILAVVTAECVFQAVKRSL